MFTNKNVNIQGENMKKIKKIMQSTLIVMFVLICGIMFAGCFGTKTTITSIEKTSTSGYVDTYTITYSNGETSTFTVTNGKNGKDGEDGTSLSITDIYDSYVEKYGEIEYSDFLKLYLTLNTDGNARVINQCLLSTMKIYTEFYETKTSQGAFGHSSSTSATAVYTGSGIIYKMTSDGYTYVITNYHVVYSQYGNDDNGGNIAHAIYGYLYGSESAPVDSKETTSSGYKIYTYDSYAIPFEYIGGSITNDIAVIRTETENITKINEDAKPVTLASGYHVGETAIAIGNPEDEGISVTEGIVSVDNEYITLSIDGTSRSYRSIRIDTALYSGNSGGGLFNSNGELIGITNAGDSEDQNVNYAIPLSIVTGVANNIMAYYTDTATNPYKITLGVTVKSQNSKYVYDEKSGYGNIVEEIVVSEVSSSSIASTLELKANDILTKFVVNGTEHTLSRNFDIADIILTIRQGDVISFVIERDGASQTTAIYTVQKSDLNKID